MRKKSFISILFSLILITLISSCVNKKQIAYFQKGINERDTIAIAQTYIPKIQPGDILTINIGSLNAAASSFFNPYSAVSPTGIDAGNGDVANNPALSQSATPGYLVDPTGAIELQLVGSLKIGGLTTSEARELIRERLKKYLKDPTVNVRFMNYRISIMGEVAKPSVYVIPNEKITLPEALSMAGDLTIFARRDNILIIREVNGKREFNTVNLNSRDLFNSPFYYLHNNDYIYVEPGKGKISQTDRIYQILPIVFSALSLITVFVSYTLR